MEYRRPPEMPVAELELTSALLSILACYNTLDVFRNGSDKSVSWSRSRNMFNSL